MFFLSAKIRVNPRPKHLRGHDSCCRGILYAGDKRLFGWDDFPHPGIEEFRELKSYPHYFQRRVGEVWVFEESPMRGDVESEIDMVIDRVREYLKSR